MTSAQQPWAASQILLPLPPSPTEGMSSPFRLPFGHTRSNSPAVEGRVS